MRFWFDAFADPNRIAAHVFTNNPMKVSTLGLMRESASQRTMVSSRTPQARPKVEVQETLICGLSSLVRLRTLGSSCSYKPAATRLPAWGHPLPDHHESC